jgi:hypothetical protein
MQTVPPGRRGKDAGWSESLWETRCDLKTGQAPARYVVGPNDGEFMCWPGYGQD